MKNHLPQKTNITMSEDSWSAFGRSEPTTWTKPITFIYGSYSWLNTRPIHHCLTNVSVQNLWEDIKLMQEIPGVEKWGFEALFQRVVRQNRVERIKARYLSDNNRFKFFPPITVAILPCRDDMPQRDYGHGAAFSIQSHSHGGKEFLLPGLKMHFPRVTENSLPNFGEPGLLSWDKSQFAALAIDGQHRISALRSFIDRGTRKAFSADVPAAILVFDPQLPAGRDLIQITREIFIDINKNAKTVDDSRLILLDDRGFISGLARRLILQSYTDSETPSDLTVRPVDRGVGLSIPDGIPQELIDTMAGKESADAAKLKGWHFTSAFIIHRALQYFVFENKFEKFEQMLEASAFSRSSEDEMEAAVAIRAEEYEDSAEQEPDWEMLSFPPSVTEKLVDKAMRLHRAFLLGIYTGFKPYAEHIGRFRKAAEGECGADVRSVLLSEGSSRDTPAFGANASRSLLSADPDRFKRVRRIIDSLSKPTGWEQNLVWYSVFQRGVVYQPSLLRTALELSRKSTGFDSREVFAAHVVSVLDKLMEEGAFERSARIQGIELWSGIALKINANGEVGLDGSDGAARRLGLLVRLLTCAVTSREFGGWTQLKSVLSKNGLCGAVSEVQRGYARYAKAVDTLANRAKDDSEYEKLGRRWLEAVLQQVADASKI